MRLAPKWCHTNLGTWGGWCILFNVLPSYLFCTICSICCNEFIVAQPIVSQAALWKCSNVCSLQVPRKPGMDRADLLGINLGIAKDIVEARIVSCGDSFTGCTFPVIQRPWNGSVALEQ